jgi:hypothetical protein
VQVHVRVPSRMPNAEARAVIPKSAGSSFGIRHSTFLAPLCLSSYRASFVNSYSSVQVRPGAPSFARGAAVGEGCPP